MRDDAEALTWRDLLEKRHATLLDELTRELDSAFARERANSRRHTAESLNQAIRRICDADSANSVFARLKEGASRDGGKAVVLVCESGQGATPELRMAGDESGLTFPADSGAAIRTAVESRDPVTCAASASELSDGLFRALGEPPGKVYLFPLSARHEVRAVLVAEGECEPAAMELIASAAGLKLGLLEAETERLKPLPTPADAAERAAPGRSWSNLDAEDQRLHLQAQRVARVKVAEMRLRYPDALREGAASGDIYNALRAEIDRARQEFLRNFLSKSTTMVDYLHLEMLRSLAHDDDRLLGKDYPGPMV